LPSPACIFMMTKWWTSPNPFVRLPGASWKSPI
jgi:hypothetical protein